MYSNSLIDALVIFHQTVQNTSNFRQTYLPNYKMKCFIKHCWDVNEQNNILNIVRVYDWTAEWAVITSNAKRRLGGGNRIWMSSVEFVLSESFDFSAIKNHSLKLCVKFWVDLTCINIGAQQCTDGCTIQLNWEASCMCIISCPLPLPPTAPRRPRIPCHSILDTLSCVDASST